MPSWRIKRAGAGEGYGSAVDLSAHEITLKVVYYGPGLAGKTTALERVYQQLPERSRGEFVRLKAQVAHTPPFEMVPLELGHAGDFTTRLNLYTVPGQVFYGAARKTVLRGADGVVFVADATPNRLRADAESLRDLRENLSEQGLSLSELPLVVQVSKGDLEGALPTEMIRRVLDPEGKLSVYEAPAVNPQGVLEPLLEVSKRVLERLAQTV